MSQRVRIGPFRGEEAALVHAMTAVSARAMRHPWNAAQMQEAIGGRQTRCAVIDDPALPGTGLLGFVIGRHLAEGLVEIEQIAVDPDHRRRGLGQRLLATFLDAFARPAAGAEGECHLEMAASNTPARALYLGAGFVVVGRRPRYYPDGDDALLMTWRASPAAASDGAAQPDPFDPTDAGSHD